MRRGISRIDHRSEHFDATVVDEAERFHRGELPSEAAWRVADLQEHRSVERRAGADEREHEEAILARVVYLDEDALQFGVLQLVDPARRGGPVGTRPPPRDGIRYGGHTRRVHLPPEGHPPACLPAILFHVFAVAEPLECVGGYHRTALEAAQLLEFMVVNVGDARPLTEILERRQERNLVIRKLEVGWQLVPLCENGVLASAGAIGARVSGSTSFGNGGSLRCAWLAHSDRRPPFNDAMSPRSGRQGRETAARPLTSDTSLNRGQSQNQMRRTGPGRTLL